MVDNNVSGGWWDFGQGGGFHLIRNIRGIPKIPFNDLCCVCAGGVRIPCSVQGLCDLPFMVILMPAR